MVYPFSMFLMLIAFNAYCRKYEKDVIVMVDEWKKRYRFILISAAAIAFAAMIVLGYTQLKNSIPDEVRITEGQDELEGIFNNPLITWEKIIPVSGGNSFTIPCKIMDAVFLKNVKVEVVQPESVYACGNTVGIYMATEGILIVDTEEIQGSDGGYYEPAENLVQPGDYITAFNQQPIRSKSDLIDAVKDNEGGDVELSLLRRGEEIQLSVCPVKSTEGDYKLGIWVRDDTQGIGTLTYVDESGNYGALGHGISDVDTGELLNIRDGKLYKAEIVGIHKGSKGTPGELSGLIRYEDSNVIGTINNNHDNGIYGTLDNTDGMNFQNLEVGYKQEMELGAASILCSVNGNVEEYNVDITKIDYNHQDTNKSFIINVTDERLLEQTGGIVQGMSGSPVLQNGKIVGAVTHVFVQDSTGGYGIFIENMISD